MPEMPLVEPPNTADPGTSTAASTTESGGGFNAGPWMTAAGGALSAYAQYNAGRINQRVARYNAELKRIQAEQAIQAGVMASNRRGAQANLTEGEIRSAQAAGGTVVGAGTNRAVIDSSRAASEMDQLLIEINARRQAFGYQVAAANDIRQGDDARRSGNAAAISSLLDTGAQLALQDEGRAGKRVRRS